MSRPDESPACPPAGSDPSGHPRDEAPQRPEGSELPHGFTVDREGNVVDLATGEIDEALTAQFGLGIR